MNPSLRVLDKLVQTQRQISPSQLSNESCFLPTGCWTSRASQCPTCTASATPMASSCSRTQPAPRRVFSQTSVPGFVASRRLEAHSACRCLSRAVMLASLPWRVVVLLRWSFTIMKHSPACHRPVLNLACNRCRASQQWSTCVGGTTCSTTSASRQPASRTLRWEGHCERCFSSA